MLSSCTSPPRPDPASTPTADPKEEPTTSAGSARTLLAYFSRPGENYYYGGRRDLEVGNTEVLARMIADLIDCDTYRIEAAVPYSADYDATVARNSQEQDDEARPAIANPLPSIAQYDTVLVGSPIWNVRPPMILNTFLDSHDYTAKVVQPFVTYAVSGLGRTEAVYAAALPGVQLGPGLAVQGEEVARHRDDVEAWLRPSGLLTT
ncbi:Flavodoxin [Friedmanniella luteola]|uniref:Flavodoxin n=1 Tax=Friedmanniella luteola TaxID=546871 RepID=A0A1H1ZMQ3_9ACTN|nr:Flavodoxin [Friedmanniella luteola]